MCMELGGVEHPESHPLLPTAFLTSPSPFPSPSTPSTPPIPARRMHTLLTASDPPCCSLPTALLPSPHSIHPTHSPHPHPYAHTASDPPCCSLPTAGGRCLGDEGAQTMEEQWSSVKVCACMRVCACVCDCVTEFV